MNAKNNNVHNHNKNDDSNNNDTNNRKGITIIIRRIIVQVQQWKVKRLLLGEEVCGELVWGKVLLEPR